MIASETKERLEQEFTYRCERGNFETVVKKFLPPSFVLDWDPLYFWRVEDGFVKRSIHFYTSACHASYKERLIVWKSKGELKAKKQVKRHSGQDKWERIISKAVGLNDVVALLMTVDAISGIVAKNRLTVNYRCRIGNDKTADIKIGFDRFFAFSSERKISGDQKFHIELEGKRDIISNFIDTKQFRRLIASHIAMLQPGEAKWEIASQTQSGSFSPVELGKAGLEAIIDHGLAELYTEMGNELADPLLPHFENRSLSGDFPLS
jgi:hypothetical protein